MDIITLLIGIAIGLGMAAIGISGAKLLGLGKQAVLVIEHKFAPTTTASAAATPGAVSVTVAPAPPVAPVA